MRIPLKVAQLGPPGSVRRVKAGEDVPINSYVRYDGRRKKFVTATPMDSDRGGRWRYIAGIAIESAKRGETFTMVVQRMMLEVK